MDVCMYSMCMRACVWVYMCTLFVIPLVYFIVLPLSFQYLLGICSDRTIEPNYNVLTCLISDCDFGGVPSAKLSALHYKHSNVWISLRGVLLSSDG